MKKHRPSILILLLLLAALISTYFALKNLDSQSAEFQIILQGISVFLFGGIVAYVVESQNKKYEQTQQIQTSNLSRLRYLSGIKTEIVSILKPFNSLEILFFDKEKAEDIIDKGGRLPSFGESIRSIQDISKTTYWDALVPSGLLPSVVSPELLSKISGFYHLLRVLIKLFEDFNAELKQGELTSASRGISAGIHTMFLGEKVSEFSRNKLMPILKELIGNGRDILLALNTEISYLERLEGFSLDNKEVNIREYVTEKDSSPFRDITLVNMNEYLTIEKEKKQAGSRHSYYNSDPYETDEDNKTSDEPRYIFYLRLSETPPEDWGNFVEYGEPKRRDDGWEEIYQRDTAKVKGRYLIFEGKKQELLESLASLISSIEKTNEEYRNKQLVEKQNTQTEQQGIQETKHIIANLKLEIDKAISTINKTG